MARKRRDGFEPDEELWGKTDAGAAGGRGATQPLRPDDLLDPVRLSNVTDLQYRGSSEVPPIDSSIIDGTVGSEKQSRWRGWGSLKPRERHQGETPMTVRQAFNIGNDTDGPRPDPIVDLSGTIIDRLTPRVRPKNDPMGPDPIGPALEGAARRVLGRAMPRRRDPSVERPDPIADAAKRLADRALPAGLGDLAGKLRRRGKGGDGGDMPQLPRGS